MRALVGPTPKTVLFLRQAISVQSLQIDTCCERSLKRSFLPSTSSGEVVQLVADEPSDVFVRRCVGALVPGDAAAAGEVAGVAAASSADVDAPGRLAPLSFGLCCELSVEAVLGMAALAEMLAALVETEIDAWVERFALEE